MKLADHPTVRAYKEERIDSPRPPAILESARLKQMALDVWGGRHFGVNTAVSSL